MHEPYLSLISGFTGAIIGAIASLTGVWIQSRHWFRRQAWSNRERYYMDLLGSLSTLKSSLEDRGDYFTQPGSEHDTSLSQNEHFVERTIAGAQALRRLREQLGPASVFLSTGAVATLEKLIREHWHVTEEMVSAADYVSSALEVVNAAYLEILNEAKRDLADT